MVWVRVKSELGAAFVANTTPPRRRQEKAAHGHLVYVVQRGVKNGVKWVPKTVAIVPEMTVVLQIY
jgi:hypothetical protein